MVSPSLQHRSSFGLIGMSVVCGADPVAGDVCEAMLDDVNVRPGSVEVGAESCAHAVRRSVTTESQTFHQCVQASIRHRALGVNAVWE